VLANLIDNAVRHGGETESIGISTRAVQAHGRSFVEIAVRDSGPGVALEDHERIFEPYTQGGAAGSRRGLGLGLAICRRLVEAHGGVIGVEAPEEGGSRFFFTLPWAEAR
jgi:signal transduction histidine kinase